MYRIDQHQMAIESQILTKIEITIHKTVMVGIIIKIKNQITIIINREINQTTTKTVMVGTIKVEEDAKTLQQSMTQ